MTGYIRHVKDAWKYVWESILERAVMFESMLERVTMQSWWRANIWCHASKMCEQILPQFLTSPVFCPDSSKAVLLLNWNPVASWDTCKDTYQRSEWQGYVMDLVKIGSAIVLVITTMNDTHKIWQESGRNYIGIDKSTCTFTKTTCTFLLNYMYFLWNYTSFQCTFYTTT